MRLKSLITFLLVMVLGGLWSGNALAGGKPEIQTLKVDDTISDPYADCGFAVQDHEVGTVKMLSFPDGRTMIMENLRVTSTNMETGRSVDSFQSLKLTTDEIEKARLDGTRILRLTSTFTGLNFRFSLPGSPSISAGRGQVSTVLVFDENGELIDFNVTEVTTPHLPHWSDTICGVMSGIGDSITGTIRDERTHKPLANMCVFVHDLSGDTVGFALSGNDGSYSARGTTTPLDGRYKLEFRDCTFERLYFGEWYRDKASLASADPVLVVPGSDTRKIDANLARGGTISGKVLDAATGEPLFDFCVEVFDGAGSSYDIASTGSDGSFITGGLPSGSYRVYIVDCEDPARYQSEWYRDKPDLDSADPVAVVQGRDTPIKVTLTEMGKITGVVRDASTGQPITTQGVLGLMVFALGQGSGGEIHSAWVGENGSYTITGLPTADYKVEFWDRGLNKYVGEWYDDKPDEASADLVHVSVGHTTSGIDAALSVGGSVSGTVTDEATGLPLEGACVSVDGGERFVNTAADGTYRYGGLATGDHTVKFSDCHNDVYAAEWYDNQPSSALATPVGVTLGSERTGIDAALEVGAVVTGRVTDEVTGAPLESICATLSGQPGYSFSQLVTDADGSFSFTGVGTGSYTLVFQDCAGTGYAPEFYDDQYDYTKATTISVVAGATVANLDAGLAAGGSVIGTVTDEASGLPIEGECVSAVSEFWNGIPELVGFAETGLDGTYRIEGLPTGNVKLVFYDCDWAPARYVAEFYDGKPDYDTADPVAVTVAQSTAGIDAALTPLP